MSGAAQDEGGTVNLELLLDGFGADQRRRGLRDGTLQVRRDFLSRLFLSLDPRTVTPGDLEGWFDRLTVSNRSRAAYLSHASMFFDWLARAGFRDDNPSEKLVRPRLVRLLPRPTADFDLQQALAKADARMRCWLLLAAYAGLRCFEIAPLKREHILDGQYPEMLMVEDGKGGKPRVVPLNPLVLDALRAHGMPARGFIFRKKYRTGERYSASTVSAYIARFLHEQGIPTTAHSNRHWFGTNVYRTTKDLLLTQALMGHASPETTAGYVAITPGQSAVDAVRDLSVTVGSGHTTKGFVFRDIPIDGANEPSAPCRA